MMEAKFSQSKKVIPITKLPMFSVYLFKDDADKVESINELKENITNACTEARKKINKMGFPSMHSNILLKDLSEQVNQNTGGGVGGYATSKGKYMAIGLDSIDNPNYLIEVIIHEWAHLWMFNNSEGFKRAVREYYETLLNQYKTNLSIAQKEREKKPFKNITKYNSWELSEKLLGRDYNDKIWDEVVREMMYIVRNIYQGYVINKYNDDDSPWKEDEQTYFNSERDNFKIKSKELIKKIINDIQKKLDLLDFDMGVYDKQLNYLSNAITKLFYDRLVKNIKRSVEADESVWNWAKEDEENWVSKFESISDYLLGETKYNENFIFANDDPYTEISNKFDELDHNKYGIVPMILNFVNNIFENTIAQVNFPHRAHSLSGEDKSTYREEMKDMVKWVNSYGMANNDELWATGIEKFIDLPPNHRKAILNLMGTGGQRPKPNRRYEKYIKSKDDTDLTL